MSSLGGLAGMSAKGLAPAEMADTADLSAGFKHKNPKKRVSPYFSGASRPASPADSPAEVAAASTGSSQQPAALRPPLAEDLMGSPDYLPLPKKRRAHVLLSSDDDDDDDAGETGGGAAAGAEQAARAPLAAAARNDRVAGDSLFNDEVGFAAVKSKERPAASSTDEQLEEAIRRSMDSSQDADADIQQREAEELERALKRSVTETDIHSGPYYEPGERGESDRASAGASAAAFYNPKERPKERLPSEGKVAARGFNPHRGGAKPIPVGRRSRVKNRGVPDAHQDNSADAIDLSIDEGEEEELELDDSELDDEDDSDEEDVEADAAAVLLASCESTAESLKLKLAKALGDASSSASAAELESRGLVMQPPTVGSDTHRLKPYQLLGLNWLYLLYRNKLNGILGDEMGLGKTVQATALIGQLHHVGKLQPTIVVAPASVLENWEREVKAWLPSAWVMRYHGSQKHRDGLRDELRQELYEGCLDRLVLICAYTLFQSDTSDAKKERKFLNKLGWGYCILDEGHSIKNAGSKRYKRLSQLECTSKLLLTGTPIQNNTTEIFSILHFLLPKLFTLERVEQLQEEAGDMDAARDKVQRIMAPFILRRLKSEVLGQLTPKTEKMEELPMLPAQRGIYDKVIASYKARKEGGTLNKKDFEHIFTELRKVANHPLLSRHEYGPDLLDKITSYTWQAEVFGRAARREQVAEEIATMSDIQLHELCGHYPQLCPMALPLDQIVRGSCKLLRLRELVPKLSSEGHRMLIFSQWTTMLDLLEELCADLVMEYRRLDGSTAVAERQEMVDEFNQNTDIKVFLLSTRAGGLGLNLTGADTCIFHDLDFNPQNDRQAEDRCHRLGQTRPVTVYKLVSAGSVDAKIAEIASRKAAFADETLCESGGAAKSGGGSGRDSPTVGLKDVLSEALAGVLD